MAEPQIAKQAPKPPKTLAEQQREYATEVSDTMTRMGAAALGAVKAITTDVPGMLGDLYDMTLGDKNAPNRSNQMFEAITGIKPTESPQELIGSLMNPQNAAKAMIVGAITKVKRGTNGLTRMSDVDTFLQGHSRGSSPSLLYEDTGIFTTDNKRLKSAISDKSATINPNAFFTANVDGTTKNFVNHGVTLPDVLQKHPELFALYPQLKNIKLDIYGAGKTGEAYFDRTNNIIGIAGDPSLENIRSTILHEVQHAIQRAEGFEYGTSPTAKRDPKLVKAEQALNNKLKGPTLSPEEMDAAVRYKIKIKKDSNQAIQKYANTPGEQEARFTQATRNLSEANLTKVISEKLQAGRSPTTWDTRNVSSGRQMTDEEFRQALQRAEKLY